MSFNLGNLWNTLVSVAETTNEWFTELGEAIGSIDNTGQGLFAGLNAFGSQLWDAIVKAFSYLGDRFKEAFKYIYDGLKASADTFGKWVNSAFSFIAQGLTWVGNQLYNFGAWLYNGLKFVWNWIVNAAVAVWEGIKDFFAGVATALKNWWSGVTTTVNVWWTNLIKGFRNKVRDMILADVTIMGAWKSVERLWNAQSTKDYAFGIMGLIASPIVGHFAGRLIDSVIPIPATEVYPLIPDIPGFEYTPPSITITQPSDPGAPGYAPPPVTPGAPSGTFTGTTDAEYDALDYSYQTNVAAGLSDKVYKGLDYAHEEEIT